VIIPELKTIVGFLLISVSATCSASPAATPDPEKDPQMLNLLREARTLIDGKKPQPAIEKCEKVIASFKAYYGNSKSKIYCARGSTESLA
jgi:hypothetical protein